jgi:hypothetical protein
VGPRIEVLYWLARELVWWWLIASLAAIALCYMWRQPLIAEALPELARSLRRHR